MRTALRADEITTKSEAAATFASRPSGQVLAVALIALVIVRAVSGAAHLADLIVIVLTVVLAGPFEWVVHRTLLHAPAASVRRRVLRTGHGHFEHHKDPLQLRWLMINGGEALLFSALLGCVAASFAVPIAWALGAALTPTFLTAWATAAIGLLHYEWTHLLVHTRYRCRSRYYKALQHHHRLHHYRNEHYWLGVTVRTGDRIFKTMPERGAVPLSATARSLDPG